MSSELIEPDEETSWPGESFLEAARLHCQAKIAQAEAKIGLYLEHPVGVGDHPNVMEEILKAAEEGCHAEDMLKFLSTRW